MSSEGEDCIEKIVFSLLRAGKRICTPSTICSTTNNGCRNWFEMIGFPRPFNPVISDKRTYKLALTETGTAFQYIHACRSRDSLPGHITFSLERLSRQNSASMWYLQNGLMQLQKVSLSTFESRSL